MRTYIDGTRRIIRIGIAALRSARQHISDARDCVGRLGLVSLGVCEPLHGSCIDTHGWLADNVWIARHAREAVAAFAQDHFIALCICIDDSCGLRNVIWSSGRCPSYFFLRRVTGLRRSLGFGTAHKPESKYQRSEEHTSELQSHRYLHSFPTRRSSDLWSSGRCPSYFFLRRVTGLRRSLGFGTAHKPESKYQ